LNKFLNISHSPAANLIVGDNTSFTTDYTIDEDYGGVRRMIITNYDMIKSNRDGIEPRIYILL
jgi:hypothetical protein